MTSKHKLHRVYVDKQMKDIRFLLQNQISKIPSLYCSYCTSQISYQCVYMKIKSCLLSTSSINTLKMYTTNTKTSGIIIRASKQHL